MTLFRIMKDPPPGGFAPGISSWPKESPEDGGIVHAVSGAGRVASAGQLFLVEANESLSKGQECATTANGKLRALQAGDVHVATTLESISAGETGWVVTAGNRQT